MEAVSRELDHAGLVTEQRQEVRSQQTSVKLANGIDATAKQANARQVGESGQMLVEEVTPLGAFLYLTVGAEENANLILSPRHKTPLIDLY